MRTLKLEVSLLLLMSMAGAVLFNQFSGRGLAWVRQGPASYSAADTTAAEEIALPSINFAAGAPTSSLTAGPQLLPITQAYTLHQQKAAVFVDAREAERFSLGHVAGAWPLPLTQPEQWRPVLQRIGRDQVIVAYGDQEGNAGSRLALALLDSGYAPIYRLDGGYDAWRNAGYPIEISR